MLVARPLAVFLCLAPFRFNWREKVFIAWTGLRGAVAIFLASIPMLVGLSKAYLYFDVAFVVVIISLLLQGWTLAPAARRLHVALPRADRGPRRVELDLPGQLEQQLVGYPVRPKSLYFRRGLIPSWSKPTLVIRDERILSPAEADPVAPGDYIYLLAPPEKAEALDRFFVDMPPSSAPDPHLLGDFMVSGEHTLGELAEIYGVAVDEEQAKLTLADYFDIHLDHAPKEGAELVLDPIVLVARSIGGGRVNVVGLRLPEDEEEAAPLTRRRGLKRKLRGDLVVGGGGLAAPSCAGAAHAQCDVPGQIENFRRRVALCTSITLGTSARAAPSPRRTPSTRPRLQHHDLRRQLAHLGGVVADIDHRHIGLVAQPHQIRQDLHLALLVERAERLVEQQQPRLRQQRAAERDALALAAGELPGRRSSRWPMSSRSVTRLRCAGSSREAVHAPAVVEILRDIEMRKQPRILEHIADAAAMRRHMRRRSRCRRASRRRAR